MLILSNSNPAVKSESESPSCVPPILESLINITSPSFDLAKSCAPWIVRYQKCSCGSSWCPACFKRRGVKIISSVLKRMDWKRVREITLTVDRSKFDGPEEAYKWAGAHRALSNFIYNLKRAYGIGVISWVWIMEFHKDGFSHWHLYLELNRKGMIGGICSGLGGRWVGG